MFIVPGMIDSPSAQVSARNECRGSCLYEARLNEHQLCLLVEGGRASVQDIVEVLKESEGDGGDRSVAVVNCLRALRAIGTDGEVAVPHVLRVLQSAPEAAVVEQALETLCAIIPFERAHNHVVDRVAWEAYQRFDDDAIGWAKVRRGFFMLQGRSRLALAADLQKAGSAFLQAELRSPYASVRMAAARELGLVGGGGSRAVVAALGESVRGDHPTVDYVWLPHREGTCDKERFVRGRALPIGRIVSGRPLAEDVGREAYVAIARLVPKSPISERGLLDLATNAAHPRERRAALEALGDGRRVERETVIAVAELLSTDDDVTQNLCLTVLRKNLACLEELPVTRQRIRDLSTLGSRRVAEAARALEAELKAHR
jgi:hypothetical protein